MRKYYYKYLRKYQNIIIWGICTKKAFVNCHCKNTCKLVKCKEKKIHDLKNNINFFKEMEICIKFQGSFLLGTLRFLRFNFLHELNGSLI